MNMSHFALLVVTNEAPTEGVLQKALQPFHEFECTGTNDQYVVDVDVTAEARETFEKDTKRFYVDPEGVQHDPYLDSFYREFTPEELEMVGKGPFGTGSGHGLLWHSKDWGDGKGYRAKVHYLPEGWQEINVASSTVTTFAEHAADYYGVPIVKKGEVNDQDTSGGRVAVDENGEVIAVYNRTNPNKKWDWWAVGGRYSNRLRVKGDTAAIDSAAVGNIDFDAMLHDRKRAARDRLHEAVQKLMLKHPDMKMDQEQVLKLWAAGVVALKAARHIWEEQGKAVAFHEFLKTHEPENAFAYASKLGVMQELEWSGGFPDDQADLLAYIEGLPAISTFAFLTPDGKWYEQGEMGWWGCVSNEDKVAFDISFKQMLDSLAPDQFITFVDCHI